MEVAFFFLNTLNSDLRGVVMKKKIRKLSFGAAQKNLVFLSS